MKIKILIVLSSLSLLGAACSSTSQTASNGEAVLSSKSTASATSTPSQVASTSASASEAHKGWHPMKLLREALDACSLNADQQTKVTALRDAFFARHQKTETAQQVFRAALADQVAAGTIDRAKLKPQLDALGTAVAANKQDNLAAIASLHDLLDPKQRNTFVDFIESHGPQHGGDDAGQGHPHRGPGGHGGFGPLKEWRETLQLTDAQMQQIRQAMRDKMGGEGHKAMFKHLEAMHAQLEAFRADAFTPDATLFSFDKMSDHMLTLAEIAEPILTPEQRQLAAQKLRDMPKWHMGDAGK